MSFTFEARTLLALGKELISTDEVALYELIKNAFDAKSTRVEILVTVRLTYSNLVEARARLLEEGHSVQDVREFLAHSLLEPDHPDSRKLLDSLPVQGEVNEFLEVLEAEYRTANTIKIQDTGEGMSLADLKEVFLRIGTRSRRTENLQGARNLGDKGIGRLSAMRLGDQLQVKTTRAGEDRWNLLDIDWTVFTHDTRSSVEDIQIEPFLGEEKHDPATSGTRIVISGLQSDWDFVRFSDILQGRIARMIDPFEAGLANRLLVPRHNGKRVPVPSIPRRLLDAAHAVCHVEFIMENREPRLTGFVDYRLRHRRIKLDQRGAEVYSLAQNTVKRRAKRGHAAFRPIPVRPSAFAQLGKFSCDIYWYNRRVVDAVSGLSSNAAETRREISNWSGGPMLYRYGFRILPYGDPSDDWLGLDEAAFGSSGFKLNRQQIIGRVQLDTPHTALSEQTNREGLIQSDVADALRKVLIWVVHNELRGLINQADEIEQMERRAAEQDTRKISGTRRRVEAALTRVREGADEGAREVIEELAKGVAALSDQSTDLIRRIEAVISEAENEREKFVYLAGIGLMAEFIFHELERAVSRTMEMLGSGALCQAMIDSLREQLKTLHKRIAAFDELTGEKRQTKSSFDLTDLVDNVLSNHAKEFERHGIQLGFERPTRPYPVRAVRGMVIQILENLIVNSAYWLKQQKRFEPGYKPRIKVVLDVAEKSLTVEDNGPGVPTDRRERIFQPFITTKPTGQGRGLGLYIARDLADYHGWKLRMDDEVGRIREGRINMFVLDMSIQ
ncbi:MAG: sensor histidine kinase [Rhodobacteraceae bacterium]|nr:sensor histidine kinase [Paracoccaceae bacterium]